MTFMSTFALGTIFLLGLGHPLMQEEAVLVVLLEGSIPRRRPDC